MYYKILDFMAVLCGFVGAFGYLLQTYKIVKYKNVKSVSVFTYFIFLTTIVVWLMYGIAHNQSAIIISNIVGGISALSVIISYYIFRNNKNYISTCHKLFGTGNDYHKIKAKRVNRAL